MTKFKDLDEYTDFVKIVWNNEVIYDDCSGNESLQRLEQIFYDYRNKLVESYTKRKYKNSGYILTINSPDN